LRATNQAFDRARRIRRLVSVQDDAISQQLSGVRITSDPDLANAQQAAEQFSGTANTGV